VTRSWLAEFKETFYKLKKSVRIILVVAILINSSLVKFLAIISEAFFRKKVLIVRIFSYQNLFPEEGFLYFSQNYYPCDNYDYSNKCSLIYTRLIQGVKYLTL